MGAAAERGVRRLRGVRVGRRLRAAIVLLVEEGEHAAVWTLLGACKIVILDCASAFLEQRALCTERK